MLITVEATEDWVLVILPLGENGSDRPQVKVLHKDHVPAADERVVVLDWFYLQEDAEGIRSLYGDERIITFWQNGMYPDYQVKAIKIFHSRLGF